MTKKHWLGLSFLFGILLMMALVLCRNFDIKEILRITRRVSTGFLLIGAGMVLLHSLLGGTCIRLFLRSLGAPARLWSCIKYSCIEVFYSGITPSATGGQPAQAYYMAKDGIPVSKSTIVLLLITTTYKIVLIGMGVLVAVLRSQFVFHKRPLITVLFLVGIAVNCAVVVFCLVLMYSKTMLRKVVRGVISLLAKCKLNRHPERTLVKFEALYQEYQDSARYIRENLGVSLRVIGITLIQRLALFSVAYFVYRAFGRNGFSFLDLLSVQVVTAIAVDSLPFPGGAGITELLFVSLYGMIYGSDLLIPGLLLTRGIQFYFYFILSSVVSIVAHLIAVNKEKVLRKRIVVIDAREEEAASRQPLSGERRIYVGGQGGKPAARSEKGQSKERHRDPKAEQGGTAAADSRRQAAR